MWSGASTGTLTIVVSGFFGILMTVVVTQRCDSSIGRRPPVPVAESETGGQAPLPTDEGDGGLLERPGGFGGGAN